jgi:hypothetical protein
MMMETNDWGKLPEYALKGNMNVSRNRSNYTHAKHSLSQAKPVQVVLGSGLPNKTLTSCTE